MIDISLKMLPVLKLLPGEYILNDDYETFEDNANFALVVDEKGSLLGKIPLYFLNEDIPISKLRSLIEPVKNTILKNSNAMDLIEHFNNNKKSLVYVTDEEKRLVGDRKSVV